MSLYLSSISPNITEQSSLIEQCSLSPSIATEDCNGTEFFEDSLKLYKYLINSKREERENLYRAVTSGVVKINELTKEHFLLVYNSDSYKEKTAEELIYIILKDIMVFPELYTDIANASLEPFFKLLDETGFKVYFISSSVANILIKSHGSVAIANPKLGEGISVSGAGDPTRIKLKLSDQLRKELIDYFSSYEIDSHENVVNRFGDNREISNTFSKKNKEGEWINIYFDSKAIDILLALLPESQEKNPFSSF